MPTSIQAIVATDPMWLIGAHGEIPWKLSADLARFKSLTLGGTVIMGRRTHESIGRALPGRLNIVLSRQKRVEVEAPALLAGDLKEALEMAGTSAVWIIGGATLYEETLPLLDALHLTVIHREFRGDVRFPFLAQEGWEVTFKEPHPEARLPHTFLTLRAAPGDIPLLDPSQTRVPWAWFAP